MNRTQLMAGLIIIIICAAGIAYFFTRPHTDTSYVPPAVEPAGQGVVGNAKLDTDPYDVLITYTDEGFSPADVSVAQGTRVRFLNDSSSTFWPAVGVHPTHTLYPEKESTDCLGSAFDACQPLQKGEFYDFTFYYVGAWPFHDHLKAFNTGTITVSAATSSEE